MGEMKKETYKNYPNPVLFKANVRPLPLINSEKLPIKNVIKAGTLINTGTPLIQKYGKVYEAVTAGVTVKMYKEHSFGVGDTIYDGATARIVTAIVETNDDYDTFTVDGVVTFTVNEVVNNGLTVDASTVCVVQTVTFDDGDDVTVNVTDLVVLSKAKMPNYYNAAASHSYGIRVCDDDIQ